MRRERETAGLDLAAARQQTENARRDLETSREERRTAERELGAALARAGGGAARRKRAGRRAGCSGRAERVAVSRLGSRERRAQGGGRRRAPGRLRAADAARVDRGRGRARDERSRGPRAASGIALLDRDVVSLEPVAAELEAAGIEVRLAHQPEELALLLKSPDASAVDAIVCDVMSFRPDQNVAGLLRGWDKDRPGLASYLSYDAQSSVELERARRTPMSLTAGHITRPLTGARLGETLDNLAKRLGKTSQ